MKKAYNQFLFLLFLAAIPYQLSAQSPQGFSYQAVVRDGGNVLANQLVTIEFTIEENGIALYQESHTLNTNQYGLVTTTIGEGTVSVGDFETLDWGGSILELNVKINSGSGLQDMGTAALQSVPYSQYSDRAYTVDSLNLTDLRDVSNTLTAGQLLQWTGTEWITVADQVNDADADPGNEIQDLSLSGSTLSISGGNSVSLPAGTSYTGGNGINISGGTITNTKPDQTVSLTGAGATNVTGTYPNFTITSTDNNTAYTAGTGISITGSTITNTDPDQTVSITGTGAATVTGTYPNFTVNSTDNNTTYTAGTGISITGTTIDNSGDTDASDDIIIGTSAGGDLNGTYPNPVVRAIRGNTVSSAAPAAGQILKWDGSQWAPAADDAGSSVWSLSGSNAYYNGGDVGIGTTSPNAKFEIFANSSLSDPHIRLHENGNDYARLNFENNNGSNYWSIAAYIASNHRNDRLNFWNGVGGDVMTITGDGEVGIGVGISPKVPFHVGNSRRVLFGIDTLGNGDKLMFLPDLHAFRVGTVATGAASTYWNRDSIGLYSFASGLNTRAQGFGATAMGRDTEATNSYAFASGFFSNADGQYSTAMGFNTDAFALGSTALGYSTDAEENYSFAAGYFAEAQAIYSVAIGNAVQAQSYASMAVGRYNVGGGSATTWNTSDPIFEIGIGTGPSSRANAVTVRKNGNVGIGTTVPLDALHVNGRVRFQTVEYLEDGGTSEIAVRGDLRPTADNTYDIGTASLRWDDVYATNGTINTSDRRDKENIEPISYGLTEVMLLNPVSFSWKNDPEEKPKLGLIAQELQTVVPEVVKSMDFKVDEETEEQIPVELDRLGVYYSDLIPVLIKGMQEQQEIIDSQNARIEALEKKIAEMEE